LASSSNSIGLDPELDTDLDSELDTDLDSELDSVRFPSTYSAQSICMTESWQAKPSFYVALSVSNNSDVIRMAVELE
jgi:hypothetical protein